ncbi:ribosomal protein L32 [Rhizophagus clarus]|uniref:Ribosomal protein L32 n=1 Tax=Rhizophagus clarus TaxID=94130 RepID=A0A8H3R132_9GLOM|nr:ribosomal protein L32 [Rhizophagus clarus]
MFSSLAEMLGPILWAVPKKKTSHSKKRMRSANKGLKDKTNIILIIEEDEKSYRVIISCSNKRHLLGKIH